MPCALGAVAAWRWVAAVPVAAATEPETRPTALAQIFVVPDGDPVDAPMTRV